MEKFLKNDYLVLIIRLILGAIFVIFAAGKIADVNKFVSEINNYNILPDFFANISAVILPWIEFTCGLFLIFGIQVKASAFITGILLLIFIIAIFSAMFRGLSIECGCFTGSRTIVSWRKIGEDAAMLVCSIYLFVFPVSKFSFDNLALNSFENETKI